MPPSLPLACVISSESLMLPPWLLMTVTQPNRSSAVEALSATGLKRFAATGTYALTSLDRCAIEASLCCVTVDLPALLVPSTAGNTLGLPCLIEPRSRLPQRLLSTRQRRQRI